MHCSSFFAASVPSKRCLEARQGLPQSHVCHDEDRERAIPCVLENHFTGLEEGLERELQPLLFFNQSGM